MQAVIRAHSAFHPNNVCLLNFIGFVCYPPFDSSAQLACVLAELPALRHSNRYPR